MDDANCHGGQRFTHQGSPKTGGPHHLSHLLHHYPHVDDDGKDHGDTFNGNDDQVDAVDRHTTLDGDLHGGGQDSDPGW